MIRLNAEAIEEQVGESLSEFQKVMLRASQALIDARVKGDHPDNSRISSTVAILPEEIGEKLKSEVQDMANKIEEDDREDTPLNKMIDQMESPVDEHSEKLYFFRVRPVERKEHEKMQDRLT